MGSAIENNKRENETYSETKKGRSESEIATKERVINNEKWR